MTGDVRHHARKKRVIADSQTLPPFGRARLWISQLDAVGNYPNITCLYLEVLSQKARAVLRVRHEHRRVPNGGSLHATGHARDTCIALIPDTQSRSRPSPRKAA